LLPSATLYRGNQSGRKKLGFKNFNAAYIVSTNGRAMDKIDYVVDCILEPLWRKRVGIRAALQNATLAEAHYLLEQQNGLGSFMAAQVVADLKYAPGLGQAEDWSTFAASGPGSRRGLNRVREEPVNARWDELDWRLELRVLQEAVNKKLGKVFAPLHAQDIQNCLCEFDKYERVRLGEGTPKQLYKPRKP
jgi:hypothetical protein